jgi:predicted HTH transcriptional regulator
VAVLHTRKSSAGFDPDPVDDVLGSTGLTASADMVLALYTEQGKKGATLKGRGRDLDDVDQALQFDPLTCAWQSLGESGAVKIKENEEEILAVLGDLGKAQVHSIAKALGKDYSNMHKRISTLWTAGKIKKEVIEGKTFYFLPLETEVKEVPTHPT